ncbi:aspartic proteinase precursor [Cryomyces antarcticus]
MKTSTIAFAATLLSLTQAISLVKRDGPPAVVHADTQRRQVANPLLRDRLRRRAGTVQQTLDNLEMLYFANVSLGTPGQTLRLHLDTGSSDLWTNVASSQLCQTRGSPCSVAGTFAPNSSTTYKYLNSDFNISYVDGSGSTGDYVSDTLRIGGATLKNQQFGIGYQSSSPEGILGIGYPVNEVAVNRAGSQPYANVPLNMVQQGLINANAYSLWLNDLDASTGSILFGGVNSDKFHGSLMYLPDSVANAILKQLGATYDQSQGAAFVDCSLARNTSTVDFTFSSPTISVAMNELVIVAGVSRGQPICILGIAPAGSSTPVLGDTFLRSAYVVYDLHNNQISLAQTNFNSTTDNILEISNSTGVPDATGVASAVSSAAVATGGARNGGQPSVTSTGGAPAPTIFKYGAAVAAAGAGLLFAL